MTVAIEDLRAQLQAVRDHIDQIKRQHPGVRVRDLRADLLRKRLSLERSIRKLTPAEPGTRPADAEGWPIPRAAYVLLERELAFVVQIEPHPKHGHVLHVLTEDGKRRAVRASTVLLVDAKSERVRRCIGLRAMIKAAGIGTEKK